MVEAIYYLGNLGNLCAPAALVLCDLFISFYSIDCLLDILVSVYVGYHLFYVCSN